MNRTLTKDLGKLQLAIGLFLAIPILAIPILGCGSEEGVRHNPYAAPVNELSTDDSSGTTLDSSDSAATESTITDPAPFAAQPTP